VTIRRVSAEVFQAEGGVVQVRTGDLADILASASISPRKRSRLCAHPGPDDRLHEMMIVLDRETYIRPHRHANKSESFHMIAGELDQIIPLGPYGSTRCFYYRLAEPVYHTVMIRTLQAVFHETTNGPFNRDDADFAPWAPADGDPTVSVYLHQLRESLR
jgi:cupin fold WbuC family metalloprotein